MRKRILLALVLFGMLALLTGCKNSDYKEAIKLYEDACYEEALVMFESLNDYGDSQEMYYKCKYAIADELFDKGEFDEATSKFEEILDYSDASDRASDCKYQKAEYLLDLEEYDKAKSIFEDISNYKDSADRIKLCEYKKACKLIEKKNYSVAREYLEKNIDYKDSADYLLICDLMYAKQQMDNGCLNTAYEILKSLPADFEYDGVSVSKLVKLIKHYPDALEYCGEWSDGKSGKMTVKIKIKDKNKLKIQMQSSTVQIDIGSGVVSGALKGEKESDKVIGSTVTASDKGCIGFIGRIQEKGIDLTGTIYVVNGGSYKEYNRCIHYTERTKVM